MTWTRYLVSGCLAIGGSMGGGVDAQAQDNEVNWIRYPAISPDGQTIAFTYQGDLYKVAATGGEATPLTAHPAHDFMPVWSHDGSQLAFASDRFGNFDIFVIPATGGTARRLTYHSAPEFPTSWSADNRGILFSAARQDAPEYRGYPATSQPELYQVAAAGGRPIQVLTTPAEEAVARSGASLILYQDRKGGENPWRKHHTSAITRDIWSYDPATKTHRRLTDFQGEDRDPVWGATASEFYYLSEETGSFNVFKRRSDGTGKEQLTRFTGAPVRFLSAAATGALAFGYDGAVFIQQPGQPSTKVPIRITLDSKQNAETVVTVTTGASQMSVSPNGKEIAFSYRGDIFVTSVDGVSTKQITRSPEIETGVEFSPDGKALIYASERDGRWGIYEATRSRPVEPYFHAATLITESPVVVNARQNYQPRYSPNGRELAFIEDRNTLKVLNRSNGETRTLLTEQQIFSNNPSHHFRWSPDGQWLLFNLSVPGVAPGEVGLVPAQGQGPVINLTESGFNDRGATWVMGGKAMLWYSNRDGLRAAAQTGGSQSDVYAMFFTREAWDRFRLSREEFALVKEQEDSLAKAKPDSTKAAAGLPIKLDLDGIASRKARLTIHSSILGDALLSKDGETLYYLTRFERGLNLWTTSVRTRETRQLVALNANNGQLAWDKDQKNLFLLADGGLSKIDPANGRRESISFRTEMQVNTSAERSATFDHIWRKTRDTFYREGFHGTDWTALKNQYQAHLPGVSNGHEFAELLSEMLGELNVSHSGSTFNGTRSDGDVTASLGLLFDLTYSGDGMRIGEVLTGGPLDRAEGRVSPGAVLESIDGVRIDSNTDLAELLNRKADRNVLLVIQDGNVRRELVVRPITPAEENRLLYDRWVKRNQAEVERISGGRLGYIHLPGMNDGAYRTTIEEVLGKYVTKAGIVVDTRFNGGGDLVADLAMFLSGKAFFDYTTDARSSGFEPNFRWTKPSVTIANEANYSDGHCFAWAYQHLEIGPLIGMPVPGTCTFAGWETLGEGLRWGVPGLGVKDPTSGRYLENWQTDPDIRVANEPAAASQGRDQQLEAAIAELLKLIG